MTRSVILFLLALLVATTLLFTIFVAADEDASSTSGGAESNMESDNSADGTGADDSSEEGGAASTENDLPLIVVHKEVTEYNSVPGKELTVTVTVTNIGLAAAYNVELVDKADFIETQNQKKEELASYESMNHSYTIRPAAVGHTVLPQAEVTYSTSNAADSARLKATSNELREELIDEKNLQNMQVGERGFVDIMTQEEYDRIGATRLVQLSLYFVFLAIAIGMPWQFSRKKQKEIQILQKEAKAKNKK